MILATVDDIPDWIKFVDIVKDNFPGFEKESYLATIRKNITRKTALPIFDYSVHTPTDFSNGQIYLAEITEPSSIPDSEMSEVALFDTYPEELTYPKILALLFEKVKQYPSIGKPVKENNPKFQGDSEGRT